MNYNLTASSPKWLRFCLSLLTGILFSTGSAHAGLTVDIHCYHDTYGYYFYPYLSTNSVLPNYPVGDYLVASPEIPTNGSRLVFTATANSFNECINNDCGGGNYYSSFDSFLYGITNGLWSIWVTNGASTVHYQFKVNVSGLTSNIFSAPVVPIYPTDGSQSIPNEPQFNWSGPLNWAGTLNVQDNSEDMYGNFNYVDSASLDPSQTTWTSQTILPNGTNGFSVDYQSNVTAAVVAATPTNGAGQAISGWVSTATLESDFVNGQILFNVNSSANAFDAFLVGRYNFELTNSPGSDSSGNGNDTDCTEGTGAHPDVASTNAAIGAYARSFFSDSSYCFTSDAAAFPSLSNALTGNFTVSAWVNTTNSVNSDYANAYFGSPILFIYNSNTNSAIPLSITGSKAAFTIYDQNGNAVTLHSTTTVNDGHYHFLAVTRAQSSGLMSLYVDGNLEATGTSTTQPLQIPWIHLAGGYYVPYQGLLDDVRIYSTNLTAGNIATLAIGNIQTLAQGAGATNLSLSTSGDANWFVESTNTFNGALTALQSGIVTNYQASTLTTTVTGPGKLTFYWSSLANNSGSFDYEFDIDGNYADDIYGATAWYQEMDPQTSQPYDIPSGQHTLTWTVSAYGDTDPTEAGFLSQVLFTPPDTSPVSASITIDINRSQDPSFGDIYFVFPGFNSVIPAGTGTTTNTIESPNGEFTGHSDSDSGGSSSAILFSLSDVLNEMTNGLWTIYINKGLQTERQFQFSVLINGLTTNLLSAVKITLPTNGATNVQPTTAFQWSARLTNFSSLSVSKQYTDGSGYANANLSVTATNWPSPPALALGTNQFNVSYTSNSFGGITFTVPVDTADSQTVTNWSALANLHSGAVTIFTVNGTEPASLLNPHPNGTNFQFTFVSQSGTTNSIQYRTNPVAGLTWQTYTNILGDGTLKTIAIPFSLFNPSKQGFVRVHTQ